ncbi:ArgP/LysG family DNA-binding transcriptional regulator [Niveispirillum lacus]|uniref:ArgP/LysG family DNA-binding transcriptional regulator n=1 Tax=Niveispirillum lacus TaxID=1981099 RepID=A0A255Z4T3_9PROT|nr:LysR family transcriptional regulator ArgP [Niveispirillum lacus]OYQ36466.1 ArgP/LysG family DNA-binding transcriptional regulator [Niveispirillum lacus]
MLDYALLEALAAVIRSGGFDRAARQLNLTPSAISQRVKLLEERIGTALVVRGQPCTATPAGLRLCQHVEQVALLESELPAGIPGLLPSVGPVPLRIAVNADSLATWFIAAMAALPHCLFDLVLDDQDHSADWLRRGEVVAAVTAGGRGVPGCDLHPLGVLRYVATASPDFVHRHFADGVDVAALSRAPCLTFNAKDGLQAAWLRRALGDAAPVPAPPTHWLPSSQAFVDAALAGVGWGMNPLLLAAPHLAAGRLVALLPGTELDVPLVWQCSRLASATLGDVTRAVRRAAAELLRPAGREPGL